MKKSTSSSSRSSRTQFPTAAEFEKFIAKSGQTVSDLLLRVKLNMLSQKIQAKVIKESQTVTEQEIEKFYNNNKARFGTPERRSVEIILTKTEAEALAAKKEVESGKSFSSVAKAKSTDPVSKANGGLLPEVVKGQEEKALDEAIFTSTVNKLGGPVKTPFGYYIYEVKTITPGQPEITRPVEGIDQAAADRNPSADRAREVRQGIQKEVDRKNGLQAGICRARLQAVRGAQRKSAA